MAGEFAVVFVLFLLIGVGGGLLLYVMVRGEHDRREVTDWDSGERMARRDSSDDRQ